MNFIYKFPRWLRWILLPFVSVISWWLIHLVGEIFAKVFIFLSKPGGWSENFFIYLVNPGIAGYCAVHIAMIFAPKNKKYIGYIFGFIWIALAGAAGFLSMMTGQWPTVLGSICTIVGCAIAINDPPPEEESQTLSDY